MDHKERKWKDRIAEGIVFHEQKWLLQKTGNPYATIECEPEEIQNRDKMASDIYEHLVTMGMIK